VNYRADWIRLLLALLVTRILMGGLLYYSVGIGAPHRVAFIDESMKIPFRWLYLVTTWDTVYYTSIAQNWYPPNLAPVWAFFPLYPTTIRIIAWTKIDPSIIAFVISITAGSLSVPLFLKVARRYLSGNIAQVTALLYFILPPVFLYWGVSYSEPLFLLLCLATWHYHLDGRNARAALFSAFATLTRTYGVLIAIPLAYNYYQRRQFGKLVYSTVAPLALLGWILYGRWRSGTWLPMLAAQSYFKPRDPTIENNVIQLAMGNVAALKPLLVFWPVVTVSLTFTLFIIFLCYRVWTINRALGWYLFVSVAAISVVGIFPSVRSFPRFFSFLFPIGLSLHTEIRWIRVCTAFVFLVVDYVLWYGFLAGWVT